MARDLSDVPTVSESVDNVRLLGNERERNMTQEDYFRLLSNAFEDVIHGLLEFTVVSRVSRMLLYLTRVLVLPVARQMSIDSCCVFIDNQRAVAFTPKSQINENHNFSLKSLFDTLYDGEFELLFDKGLSSDGHVFYAGTYRCHRLSDLHPFGFIQGNDPPPAQIPWTLLRSVMNSQEPAFGQKLQVPHIARLVAAGEIKFEFIGLECVGFDMHLYRALTGYKGGRVSIKVESSSGPSTGDATKAESSQKRSRKESVVSDGDGGERSSKRKDRKESKRRCIIGSTPAS
ncbi:hypothetical protein L218DRAFT_1008907 [Marasmius fiardii PR-910]|nr:hypothetical protein L218DRAFT_1008907 [Marasmius fiardii PR-910]